jgi:hypothetical protein
MQPRWDLTNQVTQIAESHRFSTTPKATSTLTLVDTKSGLRVYVLGAGCSYHEQQGYPLATQFAAALNSYAAKIASVTDCQRIKMAVEDTVKLLNQCQSGPCLASTIDQLINLVLHGRCDDQLRALRPKSHADVTSLRYQAVRDAKIATTACFLDREANARLHQTDKYKQFIQRRLLDETGVSSSCITRLRQSNSRVLSFNYDRLFELAFFAGFADRHVTQFPPYSSEVLNSGLPVFGEWSEIKQDRFCFLKMHGSAGMLCKEDAFGENAYQIGEIINWVEVKVADELFYPKTVEHFPPEPLIAFPYEKDFIVTGKNNKLPFRGYIERVWAHATYVLREASEIWVIGYSFDPTDCKYLIDRMRQATKCRRIVIQNLPSECDRISALLTTDYELRIPVEKYPVPL